MTKKFTFSTPSCLNCQYRLIVGGSVSETRYCTGFEKKKPRRFRKSDPRIKPPQMVSQTALPSDLPHLWIGGQKQRTHGVYATE